ncbi:ATP-binding cassette domain-containing protein [Bacillus mangrovi]|uniref:ATP-binding cassette domain-containing protein n=1 Tax=Metabacillus mangrovi TaxID=1491830 RepID=A0A7X2S501_9BACI|nr:ABC transporter ATP-binding protein [Metabacillus mangrovi]MTH53630.1 ATP-binding cassette domain-containing protein [Metabacillus mangrovi]
MRPSNHQITGKKPPRPANWAAVVKRIWTYMSGNRRLLGLVVFMVTASSGLGLLGPYMIGQTIDRYIVPAETAGLGWQLVLLGAIYAGFSLSTWLQNYWMAGIAQRAVYRMRTALFEHFQKLPIAFFDKRQHGELMSRVTNDIDNVSQTLNSSFIQILSSVLTLAGTVVMMLILSPVLTALSMTIIPLMFFGMKWITKRTGKKFKEQQKHLGSLNGYIEETFSGQKIVKAFSQEERVTEEFLEKSARLREAGFWAQTYSGFIPKLMNVLNNLSFAIIAAAGGYLAIKGMITIGTIVIFVEYSRQFTRPLNDLANQFNTILSAVAGAERVFEIMDEEEEEQEKAKGLPHGITEGTIVFRDVSFGYDHGTPILKKISFQASKGEMTAFVGATGAGKTTIINLLSRFYDPTSGAITADGIDLAEVSRASLRKNMGFVLQDPFLFEGTIRENIRYGRLDAADHEVEEAAKQANAHSFIIKLPKQYDTILKQDGTGISQGQRQLLSISRAILSDPVVLILDEATSSIDTITEMKIQDALKKLMKGRTSFVIAHRLNTIQQADQIIVMDKGEIAEKGSHQQLMENRGAYYRLYQSAEEIG